MFWSLLKKKSLLLHLNTLQSPWSYASQKRPCLKVSYRWLVIFINFTSSFFVCFSVIEGCIITAVYMAWILSITQSKTWETVRDATFPIMYLHCWWALKREKDEHREICIYYVSIRRPKISDCPNKHNISKMVAVHYQYHRHHLEHGCDLRIYYIDWDISQIGIMDETDLRSIR